MTEPPESPQEGICAHGMPQGTPCPGCITDVVRNVLGISAAQEGGAAPTPLAASAIQSHELLMAHTAAGFTRAEAMQVVLLVYYVTLLKGPHA